MPEISGRMRERFVTLFMNQLERLSVDYVKFRITRSATDQSRYENWVVNDIEAFAPNGSLIQFCTLDLKNFTRDFIFRLQEEFPNNEIARSEYTGVWLWNLREDIIVRCGD